MRGDALKLPSLDVPKPQPWDFAAAACLAVAVLAAGANWLVAQATPPGTSISGGLTLLFVLVQLGLTTASLIILGKTAKEGTIWGNLLSVGALGAGMSGVLLAAAMWVAA